MAEAAGAEDLPPTVRGWRLWGVSWALCLWQAFARDPRRAVAEARWLRPTRRSWRRFSLQIHGRDFLADLYAASREAGVRPFLMWGTLLGCIREGDFLANDGDIDIGIVHTDYRRKAALIEGMRRRGYRLRYDLPYKISLWRPDRVLHMDIDVFFPWNGRMVCLAHNKGRVIGATFPADAFAALRDTVFLDLPVLVPAAADDILTAIYGNWRVPAADYDSGEHLGNRLVLAPGDPLPRPPPD